MRSTIDTLPALTWTAQPDGSGEVFNRRFLEYTGFTAEQAEGARWATALHPDDRDPLAQTCRGLITAGEPGEAEARLRRLDGEYRRFLFRTTPLRDDDGGIIGWSGVALDVEDRRRREEALAVRERNLQLTFDFLPALAWSAPHVGDDFHYNKHYLDYLGVSAEDMVGEGWTRQIHPDDLPGLLGAWNAAVKDRSPAEAEARLRRHDGEYRWFLFRVHPPLDGNRHIVRWYGVNTDIQDRKRAEQGRDKAQAELAHAARAMSFGVLTASIAHEVNQPLSGIITNAGTCLRMLSADPPNVAGALETARRTIRDGNRTADVIARLRGLFSKKEFLAEPVDLNAAAVEVIGLSRHELISRRITVETHFADDLPRVVGDRIQLQQVILNLLLNAADALVGVHGRPRRIFVVTDTRDDEACLTVRDTGVGIPVEALGNLFDAFYTTKPGGMGIGLSVSRSIIERHDGRIWAESIPGQPGAAFCVGLPVRLG